MKNDRIFVDQPFKEVKIEDNWVFLYHFRFKRSINEILKAMLTEAYKKRINLSKPVLMQEIGDKLEKQECLKLIKSKTEKQPKVIFFLLDKSSSHLRYVFKKFFN